MMNDTWIIDGEVAAQYERGTRSWVINGMKIPAGS
jgi:hypothetical protein